LHVAQYPLCGTSASTVRVGWLGRYRAPTNKLGPNVNLPVRSHWHPPYPPPAVLDLLSAFHVGSARIQVHAWLGAEQRLSLVNDNPLALGTVQLSFDVKWLARSLAKRHTLRLPRLGRTLPWRGVGFLHHCNYYCGRDAHPLLSSFFLQPRKKCASQNAAEMKNDARRGSKRWLPSFFFLLTHASTHTHHTTSCVCCVLAGATAAQPHPLPPQTRGFWHAYVVGHAVRPSDSLTAATPTRDPRIPISRAAPEITPRVTSLSALWNPQDGAQRCPPGADGCTLMRASTTPWTASSRRNGRLPSLVFRSFSFLSVSSLSPLSCPARAQPDPVTF